MTEEPNYGEIAGRVAAGNVLPFKDIPHIMALLGYETMPHGRLGMACRLQGEKHWQSCPSFASADEFELWVLDKTGATLDDIGRNENGDFYVSLEAPDYGNDYGTSSRLGRAMWTAFVRLYGRVDDGE